MFTTENKLVKAFGSLVLLSMFAALHGFTIKVLWGWFIAPVFNVPSISTAEALGISILVGYLLFLIKISSEISSSSFYHTNRYSLSQITELSVKYSTIPISVLFAGWILHFFI